jgi:hypothetical protein
MSYVVTAMVSAWEGKGGKGRGDPNIAIHPDHLFCGLVDKQLGPTLPQEDMRGGVQGREETIIKSEDEVGKEAEQRPTNKHPCCDHAQFQRGLVEPN